MDGSCVRLSPKCLPQSGHAVRAEYITRLIGPFAAKDLLGFIEYARSIIEQQALAIVASGGCKKNVADARFRKAVSYTHLTLPTNREV